jgi:Raf kinase inhibitor-like YbhB/YbcL family protein
LRFIGLPIVLFLLLAQGSFCEAQTAQGENAMTMTIKSPAFAEGQEIPIRYTGEGDDVSPPLSFLGVPGNAKSLVLIVDDPDAPDPAAPKMVFVHWVLYNMPPATRGLAESLTALPGGTGEGLNDRRRTGYTGPMPPIGRHRYFFKLYALNVLLDFPKTPAKADIEKAMQGHVLSEATLMGTYISKK